MSYEVAWKVEKRNSDLGRLRRCYDTKGGMSEEEGRQENREEGEERNDEGR